jgi:hypothetical protein
VCGRTACTVREGGTGEADAQARWTTRTRRETAGTEPIRRTGQTEPVPYFTTLPAGRDGHPRGLRTALAGSLLFAGLTTVSLADGY